MICFKKVDYTNVLMKKVLLFCLIISVMINCICFYIIYNNNEYIDEWTIERQFFVETSGTNDNVIDLVTTIYGEEDLNDINSLNLNYNLLNSLYPIECVRYINNFDYRVTYRGENKYLIINFNKLGEKKYSSLNITSHVKNEYDFIEIGTSLDEIKEFDSTGNYKRFSSIDLNNPLESFHYTIDGYIIKYTYDEYLKVIGIEVQLI